jgi:hypothetical protein
MAYETPKNVHLVTLMNGDNEVHIDPRAIYFVLNIGYDTKTFVRVRDDALELITEFLTCVVAESYNDGKTSWRFKNTDGDIRVSTGTEIIQKLKDGGYERRKTPDQDNKLDAVARLMPGNLVRSVYKDESGAEA